MWVKAKALMADIEKIPGDAAKDQKAKLWRAAEKLA